MLVYVFTDLVLGLAMLELETRTKINPGLRTTDQSLANDEALDLDCGYCDKHHKR